MLVGIGGFAGAIVRFVMTSIGKRKFSILFPVATLLINVTGSFLLGFLYGGHFQQTWMLLFGTGFMGAYTTFSTYKLENVQLIERKQIRTSILYLAVSYILGISAAFLGITIGSYPHSF
ncbi:fluoride efflux transporter CrcB [Bacillus ginsengihumi]|uniref:Fluoride-specific ion channel FluC n=2 Tax=Heyndrickxia ginsengihumi TaxID=363870 RepID=A0A0A6VB06_9BACI|nr:hypothetical protein NG54_09375 [Heyndrickxia ginsengihumi]MBE6183053.1 fluoride efflux transporter CrcB [Bacillus sp. (in: firmicutes)]NEY19063.1 fluoride efflux transporter CrcB [Heyndrickxia ginsengihumi]